MNESDNRPLKVLFVLGPGGFGGIERHVEGLIRNLDRGQIEPYLCGVKEAGPISDAIAATGVPTSVIGAKSGHEFKIIPAFLKIVDQYQIDLVHAHELQAFVALAMWFRPRLPLISSIHCAIFQGTPRLWWCRIAARTIDRRVNRYLPVSKATWLSAQKYFGLKEDQGTVFYNPIDLHQMPGKERTWLRNELGLSIDVPLVGMVGRMADQKDWPAFLEICAHVGRAREDVHFLAVGDGPLLDSLKSHPSALELGNRLHWLGFRDDARRIIGALDVFLLTSKHEELPTTLLEAFAMKTPVAGFLPAGGTAEVLAFGTERLPLATLHELRETKRVVEDVLNILRLPGQSGHMAERAFEVVNRHFEASRACIILNKIYHQQSNKLISGLN